MRKISPWQDAWQRLPRSLQAWVRDHWHGDLSLAESFWINIFFVNLGASIVWRYVILPFSGGVLWGIFSAGVSVWQLVGLWRSASKNGERQPLWSAVVKGLCVMNVVLFVVVLLVGLVGGFGEGGIDLPVPSLPSTFLET